MKRLVIAALAIGLISSCSQQNSNPTVSGTVLNAEGEQISLIGYIDGKPDTIGTAIPDGTGRFSIPHNAGRVSFFTLQLGSKGAIVLGFDSTESPVVNVDMETAHQSYDVSGSKDSEDIRNLFVNSVRYETLLDSTMKDMRYYTNTGDAAKRTEASAHYNKLREEYKAFLTGMIDENPGSLANFSALQRMDPKQDFSYFIKVRDALEPRMAGNAFFDQLANSVASLETEMKLEAALAPGVEAPEISLPSPTGEEIALSSLRGNYVLIDFWASWCKPCRMENPNVVRMYNKYADANFEIYSVSLDRDQQKWVQAIEQDKLDWAHVSDLKFWNSAAAKLYGVKSIPFTLLIDPDGKIIQTKLRGRALESKLTEIFGY